MVEADLNCLIGQALHMSLPCLLLFFSVWLFGGFPSRRIPICHMAAEYAKLPDLPSSVLVVCLLSQPALRLRARGFHSASLACATCLRLPAI